MNCLKSTLVALLIVLASLSACALNEPIPALGTIASNKVLKPTGNLDPATEVELEPVTDLDVKLNNGNEFLVTWVLPASADIDGVLVERKIAGGEYAVVGDLDADEVSFLQLDYSVAPSAEYSFRITVAKDGEFSRPKVKTITTPALPSAPPGGGGGAGPSSVQPGPTNLAAVGGPSQAALNWVASTAPGVVGIVIEVSNAANSGFQYFGHLTVNINSTVASGFPPGAYRCFRVSALFSIPNSNVIADFMNQAIRSETSNVKCLTIP